VTDSEPEEPIRLSPAEEKELSDAMEQIRRGESIDGKELLKDLPFLRLSRKISVYGGSLSS